MVNSIEYLTEGGELIAVLPQGSLTSEKDATTWSLLRRMGETESPKDQWTSDFRPCRSPDSSSSIPEATHLGETRAFSGCERS